jgi:hypothetical protein
MASKTASNLNGHYATLTLDSRLSILKFMQSLWNTRSQGSARILGLLSLNIRKKVAPHLTVEALVYELMEHG